MCTESFTEVSCSSCLEPFGLPLADIKPSNILANTAGEIKICDFGVSGELINSIANTFVGTSTYMSVSKPSSGHLDTDVQPERIQGAAYTIKSDVWSLGISLIELALGRFPFTEPNENDSLSEDEHEPYDSQATFDADATLPLATRRPDLEATPKRARRRSKGVSLAGGGSTMSILDLLQHIVNEPAPRLVSRRRQFPPEAVEFVEGCLNKDPGLRKSPQELLVGTSFSAMRRADQQASPWIVNSKVTKDDLQAWAKLTKEE